MSIVFDLSLLNSPFKQPFKQLLNSLSSKWGMKVYPRLGRIQGIAKGASFIAMGNDTVSLGNSVAENGLFSWDTAGAASTVALDGIGYTPGPLGWTVTRLQAAVNAGLAYQKFAANVEQMGYFDASVNAANKTINAANTNIQKINSEMTSLGCK